MAILEGFVNFIRPNACKMSTEQKSDIQNEPSHNQDTDGIHVQHQRLVQAEVNKKQLSYKSTSKVSFSRQSFHVCFLIVIFCSLSLAAQPFGPCGEYQHVSDDDTYMYVLYIDTGQIPESMCEYETILVVTGYRQSGEWIYSDCHNINNDAHDEFELFAVENQFSEPQESADNGESVKAHNSSEHGYLESAVLQGTTHDEGTHRLHISEHCSPSLQHTWVHGLELNVNTTFPEEESDSNVSPIARGKQVITGHHYDDSEHCPAVYPPRHTCETCAEQEQHENAHHHVVTCSSVDSFGDQDIFPYGLPVGGQCVDNNTHDKLLVSGYLTSHHQHVDTFNQWRNDHIQEPVEHTSDIPGQLVISGQALATVHHEDPEVGVGHTPDKVVPVPVPVPVAHHTHVLPVPLAHPTDDLGDSSIDQRVVVVVSDHYRHQPVVNTGDHHELAITNLQPTSDQRRPVVLADAEELTVTGQRHLPWWLLPPPVHSSVDIPSTPPVNATEAQDVCFN